MLNSIASGHSKLAFANLRVRKLKDCQRPEVKHVLGGSVGEPVYIPKVYDGRNKTFFFFTYEEYTGSGYPNNFDDTVPTTAMRQGDFSSFYKPPILGRATWAITLGMEFSSPGLKAPSTFQGRHWLSGASKGLNEAVGGWQITPMITLQSGEPLTPEWCGSDPTGTAYTTSSTPAEVCIRPDLSANPNSVVTGYETKKACIPGSKGV